LCVFTLCICVGGHRHFGCTCYLHAQSWRDRVKLDAVMIKMPLPNA
jgi:hypothetical protein